MSLSEVTMEHQTVQTVLTEKFPGQGRVLLRRKEKGLFKNLRTERSSIHSQAELQIQEAFILFQSNVEATITSSLTATPTGKLVFCRQWLLEVREIRERYWNVRKHPESFWGGRLATRISYCNLEGKQCINTQRKGGTFSPNLL